MGSGNALPEIFLRFLPLKSLEMRGDSALHVYVKVVFSNRRVHTSQTDADEHSKSRHLPGLNILQTITRALLFESGLNLTKSSAKLSTKIPFSKNTCGLSVVPLKYSPRKPNYENQK